MKKIVLSGLYKGTGISPQKELLSFDAQVPGCVHTDLQRSGMLGDLFYGTNAKNGQWLEDWDFEFCRLFEVDEVSGNEYLQFEGLDVFCDIWLNNVLLGSAEDMFIEYRFATGANLLAGENELKIHFYSTMNHVADKPKTPVSFSSERLYVRRMQCTFGWDWVEKFVTCGIWKDVYLCMPGKLQMDSVYIRTARMDDLGAQVVVEVDFTTVGQSGFDFLKNESLFVHLEILDPEGGAVYTKRKRVVEKTTVETIDIRNPQLWWPNGYGEQPLYEAKIKVTDDSGEMDFHSAKFGIRTIRIMQMEDKPGSMEYTKSLELKTVPHLLNNDLNDLFSGFILLINGTPIMCKGANWVPCEPFPSNVKPEKITELLKLAKEGNLNMLRVWGGGIFEDDSFYDQCDEMGLLVTQDFMMACARYPEDEDWFIENIAKETVCAAKRLRNHPSLAWWTGDNENGGGGNDNIPDYPGRKTAMETVLPILGKYDPDRMFLPTSPFGGNPYMSATKGTTHNTFYLNEMRIYIQNNDLCDYKKFFEGFLARFVPEEPTMGAPSEISLGKFMTEEEIFGDNEDAWRFHTRNHPAPEFLEFGLYDMMVVMAEKLFGPFKSAEDKLLKMQYVQYEWIRITMENFRRNKWYSSGLLYWMFNDCWPASGWAIVDYYALPKAGYYGFKRSAKGVIACINKEMDFYRVFLCNDTPHHVECRLDLFLQSTKSHEKSFQSGGLFKIQANTSKVVLQVKAEEIDPFMTLDTILLCSTMVETGESSGIQADLAFYLPKRPRDIQFYEAKLDVMEQTEEKITLRSDAFVYAVRLDGEYIFEDNYFMLLPDQEKTIMMRPSYEAKNKDIRLAVLKP